MKVIQSKPYHYTIHLAYLYITCNEKDKKIKDILFE